MVNAGKIFKLTEKLGLDAIAMRLKDYRREEVFQQGKYSLNLLTEIKGLSLKVGALSGVIAYDKVIYINRRGEVVPEATMKEAPFVLSEHGDKVLLLVIGKKYEANRVANLLSETLFIKAGKIVEGRIPEDVLKRFHLENPEATKLIWFDDMDIPNIEKLSLCGPSLADTSLYSEYSGHGQIWYIVFKSKRYGYITGVTRNGIVALFNRVDEDDFVGYVMDEIFPLVV